MTTVIELYGGPGIGKSTFACELYVNFKKLHINCELVREFAKDWAWKDINIDTWDQFYFLGNQLHRESILYNKVDYAITDSPLWLAGFYESYNCGYNLGPTTAALRNLEFQMKDKVKRIRFFLKRADDIPFTSCGRYQTKQSAKDIDSLLKHYLLSNNIFYSEINISDIESFTDIK